MPDDPDAARFVEGAGPGAVFELGPGVVAEEGRPVRNPRLDHAMDLLQKSEPTYPQLKENATDAERADAYRQMAQAWATSWLIVRETLPIMASEMNAIGSSVCALEKKVNRILELLEKGEIDHTGMAE